MSSEALKKTNCEYCGQLYAYWRHLEHANPGELSPAQRVALAIYADVTDRRGIKQEFYMRDDDTIQEILESWAQIIETSMPIP